MRVLLVALLLAGCSKSKKADPGPPCPEVVDHMVEVMKKELQGHGGVDFGDRKQLIKQCEERKMSAAERKCILDAKSLVGLSNCKTGSAGSAAEPPQNPVPTRPLPTGTPEPAPAGPTAPAAPGAAGSGG